MGSEGNEVQRPGEVPGMVAELAHVSPLSGNADARLAVTMLERQRVPLLILKTTDFEGMLVRERERIMAAGINGPAVSPRRSASQSQPQLGGGGQPKPGVRTVVRRILRRLR